MILQKVYGHLTKSADVKRSMSPYTLYYRPDYHWLIKSPYMYDNSKFVNRLLCFININQKRNVHIFPQLCAPCYIG